MKKLEEKIIKKIYTMETKNLLVSFILKAVVFIFMGLLAILSTQIIIEVFKEQETFDMFQLFKEDVEIIRRYFFDVIVEVYQETPKLALVLTVVAIFILLFIIITIIKNWKTILNKGGALLRFWTKRTK